MKGVSAIVLIAATASGFHLQNAARPCGSSASMRPIRPSMMAAGSIGRSKQPEQPDDKDVGGWVAAASIAGASSLIRAAGADPQNNQTDLELLTSSTAVGIAAAAGLKVAAGVMTKAAATTAAVTVAGPMFKAASVTAALVQLGVDRYQADKKAKEIEAKSEQVRLREVEALSRAQGVEDAKQTAALAQDELARVQIVGGRIDQLVVRLPSPPASAALAACTLAAAACALGPATAAVPELSRRVRLLSLVIGLPSACVLVVSQAIAALGRYWRQRTGRYEAALATAAATVTAAASEAAKAREAQDAAAEELRALVEGLAEANSTAVEAAKA